MTPRRRTRRLGMMALEQRKLMAADIGLQGGFIVVNGTDGADARRPASRPHLP